MGTMNGNGAKVVAPERNHYFYGKLMDVAQFEMEQRYFNHKRLLINRLALGSGVVCGLKVVAGDEGTIRIEPGVAIDGWGREIIVPEAVTVDPHQLTDEQGAPTGYEIDSGPVMICLAYAEAKINPVPVLVPDCDTPGNCAHSTIRERFRVLVHEAEGNLPPPPACEFGELETPINESLHGLVSDRISASCAEPGPNPCVLLAHVSLPLGDQSIDSETVRPLVYNNRVLYELILCLAERVEKMEGPSLVYVSGDGQTAQPGKELADPLVVELVDGEGNPVEGAFVQFSVTEGGGTVSPDSVKTDQQGRAETKWTLGPAEGEQQATARAVGTASTVIFQATAKA